MSDRDLFAWLQVLYQWQVATYDLVAALSAGNPADVAAVAALRTTLKTSSDALAAAVAASPKPQP